MDVEFWEIYVPWPLVGSVHELAEGVRKLTA